MREKIWTQNKTITAEGACSQTSVENVAGRNAGRRKDMRGRRKGKWVIGTGLGAEDGHGALSWHQDWGGIVGKPLTAKIS